LPAIACIIPASKFLKAERHQMPKAKAPQKAPAAKSKTAAKSKPGPAKAAAPAAQEETKAAEAPVPAKPVKTPPAHHAGKPEQPLWARFNQNHSQKMAKGRSFRHQGR
jgi:hypothetical protein